MPKRRYERREPIHEWSQIRPLLKDTAQMKYELIRPVILWGVSAKERAAVDGDVQALNRLLEYLKEMPTPSKCHPGSLQKSSLAFIPVTSILPEQKSVTVTSRNLGD